VADTRPPYGGIYLTLRRDRTPDAFRECVAHLATYLTHDLSTPLGGLLDARRDESPDPQAVPFRAFGTSTVWYPRGLLLRVAARRACERLMGVWRDSGPPTALPQIDEVAAAAQSDPGLAGHDLVLAINQGAEQPGGGTPTDAME